MINRFFLPILTTFSLVLSLPLIAESRSHSNVNNTLHQAQLFQDTTEQDSKLNTNTIQDRWSEWGLTQEEWSRYEKLKKGAIGIWTPNLDPLTTLGISARNSHEQNRYAELLAKIEYQRNQKILEFQFAYDRAFQRLYPNQLPFRIDEDGAFSVTAAAIGRVIYFTRTDCGERCENNLLKLLNFLGDTPVDIYVVDSMQDDNKIRDWAVKNKLNIEKVRARKITLNHDSGYWLQYANGKMPAAFAIQGNGQWQPLVY